jgi:D-alanyl-lipoteichoic acid acyltransferase DltB (MBOAT superfamily)
MVYQLQYHDAPFNLVQHGLLLGLQGIEYTAGNLNLPIVRQHLMTFTPTSKPDAGTALSHKQRQNTAHPKEMYTFVNYVSYALYAPLYIAGPIMTFNDWLWQVSEDLDILRVCRSRRPFQPTRQHYSDI